MGTKENVKALRLRHGLSQEDFGKLIRCTKSAVSMYERGERNIDIDVLERICDAFDVDINILLGKKIRKGYKIPVLGKVAAGIPIEAITDILDYEEINEDMLKDGSEYFALQIKGSSMEPRIKDGDVVIVRKQEDCDSGDVAIVSINGDDATCKKVMKHTSGITLVPFNPAFETMFFPNEEIIEKPIMIWGKVVELRAKNI